MLRKISINVLWFDVGIKRYTTRYKILHNEDTLWFDVGIKRYTTSCIRGIYFGSCGLM